MLGRRQFLLGSAALGGVVAFGSVPAMAQVANLRMMFWGSQSRADRTFGVTDLFSTAHGGTTFDAEFMGFGDYWPKVATMTAGGTAPDVLQMDYRYIVEYADRGALHPLDDLIGSTLDLSDFDTDQIEAGKVDGKLYGVSLGTNSGATLFNQSALEKAGIELDHMSWTFDDLKRAGVALAKVGEMKLLADGSGVELLFENWLRQKGAALYTADGNMAFSADHLIEWFELWADLRANDVCVDAETQATETGQVETNVLTRGNAAATFVTSNQLVAFQTLQQDKLGIGIYPKVSADAVGGHYRKPSMYFSVSGGSDQVDEAVKFISFFVNDTEAGKLLGVERGVPCSAKVRDALSGELDATSQEALNFVAGLGPVIGPLPGWTSSGRVATTSFWSSPP